MRVFVTGATGFIGRAVVQELLKAGHEVEGLARSLQSAQPLIAMGAKARIGTIEDHDCLQKGAEKANGVIHLAFFHNPSQPRISTTLRVLLGGNPRNILRRFMQAAVDTDVAAITTLGNALNSSDRALITVLPTMALKSGSLAQEDDAPDSKSVGGARIQSEKAALALVSRGIRASVIRLAPVVHDSSKQGLVTMVEAMAKKKGFVPYVEDGRNRWSGVHRLDAAQLFRLALEKGEPGARYHAVAEEGVAVREIAEASGRRLNLPAISKSSQEVQRLFGWLAPFIENDNPVSSKLTQQRLGWHPKHDGILHDIT